MRTPPPIALIVTEPGLDYAISFLLDSVVINAVVNHVSCLMVCLPGNYGLPVKLNLPYRCCQCHQCECTYQKYHPTILRLVHVNRTVLVIFPNAYTPTVWPVVPAQH